MTIKRKEVRPRLDRLETHCNWLKFDLDGIRSNTFSLPLRPAWADEALRELNEVEVELRRTLSVVCEMQKRINELPIIVETGT